MRRLEYVRWLVMLHALYSALEAALFALASPAGQRAAQRCDPTGLALLTPLLQASGGDLLRALARTPALVSDINVHAALAEEEEGTSLADEADALELELEHEHAQDDASPPVPTAAAAAEVLAPLLARVWAVQAEVQPGTPRSAQELAAQRARLGILTPAQQAATGGYVCHIAALAALAGVDWGVPEAQLRAAAAYPPPPNAAGGAGAGALLTHAYTRYLGDLSGGQFIAKHVAAKWPVPAEPDGDGLAFYHFLTHASGLGQRLAGDAAHVALWQTDAAAKARAERALKDAYRAASDGGLEYALIVAAPGADRGALVGALVDSAALAFLLNGALFDSLAGIAPEAAPASAAEAVARAIARKAPSSPTAGAAALPPSHVRGKAALGSGVLGVPAGGLGAWVVALVPVALGLAAVCWRVGQVWGPVAAGRPPGGTGPNATGTPGA